MSKSDLARASERLRRPLSVRAPLCPRSHETLLVESKEHDCGDAAFGQRSIGCTIIYGFLTYPLWVGSSAVGYQAGVPAVGPVEPITYRDGGEAEHGSNERSEQLGAVSQGFVPFGLN